jgi:arylsulfatase A-like enzyme/Flp pilus assembly protein TadD
MLSTAFSLALLAARPDVIVVTIDTLRADHVGAYGSTRGATPAMDALAKVGVVVQEAVVQVPLTRPSHASIMTGLLPFQHGIRDNASPPLSRTVPTLASTLKAAGYSTAAFIGAYPVSRVSGLDRGFDLFDDPFVADSDPQAGAADRNERPAREVLDAALAWLAKPSDRPRFVWIHVFEPHYPYEPPAPFAARFRATPYDGEVATADQELRRLFDAYPATASRLVVVTSDHGEGLGDHGEDEHHLFVYDSTLRVPLILAGSDLPRASRIKGQFRSIDLMPTILDLVGVKSPLVSGVSRATNLKTGTVIPDNQSYAESLYGSIHFGYAPVRALRAEGFKYIDTPRAELYRVAADADEATNLAPTRAPLATAMQKQLRQLHGEDARQAVKAAPVDSATQERLASLGYVAGGSGMPPQNASQLPDPKDRVVQYNRYSHGINAALLARRHRDPLGVVKALMPVVPDFGSNGTVSSFLGEALLESMRFKEAIPFLETSRDASPTAWARWGRLAEAYAGAGRAGDALDATAKGLAVSPRSTELIRLRTALLTRAGRGAEAMKFLEAASVSNPADGLLLAEVASLRRNSGDLRAADTLSSRAISLAPRKADVWLSRGMALGALGRTNEAGQAFERATELDPKSADAWFYAATVEIQKGNRQRATQFLNKARELNPARPGLSEALAAARGLRNP